MRFQQLNVYSCGPKKWIKYGILLAIFVTFTMSSGAPVKYQCIRLFSRVKLIETPILQQCGGTCYFETWARSLSSSFSYFMGREVSVNREHLALQLVMIKVEKLLQSFASQKNELNPSLDKQNYKARSSGKREDSLWFEDGVRFKFGISLHSEKLKTNLEPPNSMSNILKDLSGVRPLVVSKQSQAEEYLESKKVAAHFKEIEVKMQEIKYFFRNSEILVKQYKSLERKALIQVQMDEVVNMLNAILADVRSSLISVEKKMSTRRLISPQYNNLRFISEDIAFKERFFNDDPLIIIQRQEQILKTAIDHKVELYLTYRNLDKFLVKSGAKKGHYIMPLKDGKLDIDAIKLADQQMSTAHSVTIKGYKLDEHGHIVALKVLSSWGAQRISHDERALTIPIEMIDLTGGIIRSIEMKSGNRTRR